MTPLLLSLLACGQKFDFSETLPRDDAFEPGTATADELARFEAAFEYSAERDGHSLLILRGGEVIFDRSHEGQDTDVANHIFSGTKSFSCALALALDLDLDHKLSADLSELDHGDNADIAIRHVLDFTSGLTQDAMTFSVRLQNEVEDQKVADHYAHALTRESQWPPGSKYEYGGVHQAAFGAWLVAVHGDPMALLEEHVFAPIGLQHAGWGHDSRGQIALAQGAWLTAWEWAKFGQLALDDGVWKGEQVLPAGGFERCWTGSEAMPAYGLTWWLNEPVSDAQHEDLPAPLDDYPADALLGHEPEVVAAAGHQDNRLCLVPSQELVVVRMGHGDRDWDDPEFLGLLLP